MKEYTVKILDNGNKYWYLDGKLHREDGPAVTTPHGEKQWYINDKLHREDGPAMEYFDGTKAYYLNGKQFSKTNYYRKIQQLKSPSLDGKEVEIDGKKYTLSLKSN